MAEEKNTLKRGAVINKRNVGMLYTEWFCFIKVKLWTSSPRINQSGYKAFEQKQNSDKDELHKEGLLPILEGKNYTVTLMKNEGYAQKTR